MCVLSSLAYLLALLIPALIYAKYVGQEYLIVKYRIFFVTVFLLPLSLVFNLLFFLRAKALFLLRASSDHEKKVAYIKDCILAWKASGSAKKLCTARPQWENMSPRSFIYKNSMHPIPVNLVNIVRVDEEMGSVLVEPMVTMSQLTSCLVALGWSLPVVPELDTLTVGGLINGCGIETSSHKYGLFQDICLSFEVVTCDGDIKICSPQLNPDLFYSIPWSYGTVAFLVCAELKIISVKNFVEVTYYPLNQLSNVVAKFNEEISKAENEFVEVILYSKEEGVVMAAKFADRLDTQFAVNRINDWYKKWYYTWVHEIFCLNKVFTEYIPLRHFYHRHTKSLFWEMQHIIPYGNNSIFRWLLGWLMPPDISLLKLTQTATIKRLYEKEHVAQDLLVPMKSLHTFIDFLHDKVELYPIWLCPMLLKPNPGLVQPLKSTDELYVDIGLYGIPISKHFKDNSIKTIKEVEEKVISHHGFQMLYADSYLSKDDYLRMFHTKLYDQVREKLNCEKAFVHVYDKINRKARH